MQGCGSHTDYYPGDERLQPLSIAVKELIPLVIAAAVIGQQCRGKIINFQVNNLEVVQIIYAVILTYVTDWTDPSFYFCFH